jgi:hypothetical protein
MQIKYTLPSGKAAMISVTPTKNWDGTIGAKLVATVEGIGTPILGSRSKPAGLPAWAVSAIGKLPITRDADAAVSAAINAIESDAAEHNAAAVLHIAELASVSANSVHIARQMAY